MEIRYEGAVCRKKHFIVLGSSAILRPMPDGQTTGVMDEMLEPVTRAFSREVAQALVNLRASSTAQSRIAELAEKCNEGALTPAEQTEYETYVQTLDLISVLQAKAQVWLVRHGAV